LFKKIFKKNKEKLIFLLPVLSGIFLSLACNKPFLWLLGLVGMIPLIYFSYKVKSLSKSLMGFFLFGLFFSGGVIIWVWSLNVFVWTGVQNPLLLIGIKFLYWVLFLSIVGVLSFLILGWLFFKLKTETWTDFLLFPSLWILAEFFRSFIYSLITFSSEGLIGAHNTFGFLGYILASNFNLLQLAQFGGIYLLSFIIVFLNFIFYGIFFISWKRETKIVLVGVIILVLVFPIKSYLQSDLTKNKRDEIQVGVLQTSRDPFFKTNSEKERKKFNNHLKLLGKVNKDLDIVVFPEDSHFMRRLFEYEIDVQGFYGNILGDEIRMVIDSSRIKNKEGKTRQVLYYYDLRSGDFDQYNKVLLTPGGETMPVLFSSLAKLLGFDEWSEKLGEGKYTKGEKTEIGKFEGRGIGGLFCFEIISPEISRRMTLEGAQLFFNPTSHASFRSDKNLYNQILNITKVRAVENGRYFIQSGNHVLSSVTTSEGEIFVNPQKEDSVFHKKVYFKSRQTLFATFGHWPLVLGLAIILIFIAKKFDN